VLEFEGNGYGFSKTYISEDNEYFAYIKYVVLKFLKGTCSAN